MARADVGRMRRDRASSGGAAGDGGPPIDAPRIEGWPRHVEGRGVPCQPDTYTARDRRVAFVSGVSVLPKHLARGLDVRTGALVTKVAAGRVELEGSR